MRYGYAGKIARVNLTNQHVREESVDHQLIEQYLGGKGIGTWFLYHEVGRRVDPLSPDNKLVFVVGPATGTLVPTSGRYGIIFKSPLTGIYAESYSGGHFAPQLKGAGFDAIIIEGTSKNPVYLWIQDDSVEFRKARHLWGLDTHATEDSVKDELSDKKVEVACIGPAGENLVKYACICNDYWRQAGRCGAGAVMGSKKLKAIAVRGTKSTEVAQPDEVIEFGREFAKTIRENHALCDTYRKYGTPNVVNIANAYGVFPTRYWYKGQLEEHEEINAEALLDRIWVSNRACFMCPIGCGKRTKVKEGPYAGTSLEGPDYETIFAFGGLCEIVSIEAIAKINDVCDRLGIDTITAGNTAAFAIEAYKRGKLMSDIPLRYGDAEAVLHILEKIVSRDGIGSILAEGVKKASEVLGLSEIAIHVKGLEPAGYDPRGLKGMGLAYAVSSRGACHLRSTEYIYEIRGVVDRFSTEGKASLVKEYEDRFAIFDSLIICRFLRDVCDWQVLSKICRLTTGMEMDEAKLRSIAERIVTLSRLFNTRMNISREDDCLPRRFMEEALPDGPSKGSVVSEADMNKMLDEYYRLRGWNDNGIPTLRKTKELMIT